MKYWILLLLFATSILKIFAQDTFSILAMDSTSGTVGSAGASCVDLVVYGIEDGSFLAEHFPGQGGIHTQAAYLPANQKRAAQAFRSGLLPEEIIKVLLAEDAEGDAASRQYGLVRKTGDQLQAAGYTGDSCMNVKLHLTGNIDGWYYSIQGNILSGIHILEQMENAFRRSTGPMRCRLMTAMQAAREIGADSRCMSEGTSSLFAFLKVTTPRDNGEVTALRLDAILPAGSGVEPIDSLHKVVYKKAPCP